MKLDIVYENSKMIIVNKPSGLLTQSARSFEPDLTGMVMTYERSKGEQPYAAVINRLDRPVSGLVLFAKNKIEAARLSKMMQKNTFNKEYLAVICGKPDKDKGMLTDYIVKDGKTNVSSIAAKGDSNAKEAKLEYQVIKHLSETLTLVKIHLITGRHHQIRVQFAHRNMPLLGDTKYMVQDNEAGVAGNIEPTNWENYGINLKNRQIALCAYSLTVDNKKYEIRPDFLAAL